MLADISCNLKICVAFVGYKIFQPLAGLNPAGLKKYQPAQTL